MKIYSFGSVVSNGLVNRRKTNGTLIRLTLHSLFSHRDFQAGVSFVSSTVLRHQMNELNEPVYYREILKCLKQRNGECNINIPCKSIGNALFFEYHI